MSVATIGAVGLTDTDLIIPGVPQIPYALLLTGAGSTTEVIEVRSLQRGGHVYVTRGAFGSLAVAHTAPVVVTLYDPNSGGGGGGGGVTVTGPDGTSVSATEIQTSGRVVDAGGGVAQLPGTVLKVLLSADGNGTIPSTDSFTTITLAALYDPDGYFHATNMPNENLPGLKVPVGNGGIHRIMFYASLLNGGGDVDTRVYTAIGFDSFGDTTDILRFVDGAPPPGKPYALIAAFTADLDDGEEMYFYSKNNTGSAIEVRPQTHVTLERLADPL